MAKKKAASKTAPKKKTITRKVEKSPSSQLGGILSFRWLKKMIRSQFESLDLLDRWILKKNWASLFLL